MVEVTAKKQKALRRVFWLFLVFALIAFIYHHFYYQIYDTVLGLNYQPSSEMATVIENIELTDKGMRVLRASRPDLQDASQFSHNCPNVSSGTSTLGCYYLRHIYVYDVDNSELNGIKEAVLAHELLHAVWERSSDGEKAELEQSLQKIFSANQSELSEHMESYETSEYIDELHAVIGTQLESAQLDERLRAHYAEYFKNPGKIVAYFKSYDALLTGQRKTANALYEEIQTKKAEIDRRSKAYEANFTQLDSDIDNYNRRANQGYHTEAERYALESERQNLIARQTALNQEYNEISALVDGVNAQVEEYNSMVEHLAGLFESIDSSTKPSDVNYQLN